MGSRERFEKLIARRPHPHLGMFERPHLSRRSFFRAASMGLSGYFVGSQARAGGTISSRPVETKGTAKNVIFLFLQGAPSHVDLFDFKETPGVTPADFAPETINGIRFPVGLMPRTAQVLDKLAIIRSGLSWALAHPLAQTWFQIGRNPTSALGRIAPHIGSVAAIELEPQRRPDQIFPTFLGLNPANMPGAGYFEQQYAPFKTGPNPEGLANTAHDEGQERFNRRWDLLERLDGGLRRADSPLGADAAGLGSLYSNARDLMFNPVVTEAFSYDEAESARYGGSRFGDACLVAKKVIAADQGTRFIQITHGGWDHHQDIYLRGAARSLYVQGQAEFDPAFASLLEDLDADGLLDETLVLVAGEFGRTVGNLSNVRNGRDHYLQMFYVLAGGGVKGGTVIGETNNTGAFTVEPGWSQTRDVRPEDIEATVYSALGINWTTVRWDDPLGRGFEYVPLAGEEAYVPVHELWG